MISPHLLKVVESFSTSHVTYKLEGAAKLLVEELWGEVPVFVIDSKKKDPKWCHMVLAEGPALNEGDNGSWLAIIWWSELTPDTERVLSIVPWEKHATHRYRKDFQT